MISKPRENNLVIKITNFSKTYIFLGTVLDYRVNWYSIML